MGAMGGGVSPAGQHEDANRSVTFVVEHRVRAASLARYERWLGTIMARCAQYPGHLGVQVIRPPPGGNDYAIIVRFASWTDARRWATSDDRRQLLAEIADDLEREDRTHFHPGVAFWFTPGGKRAPGWKQWLITTSVIWPLTMVVPPLFDPLFAAVPALGAWGVSHGVLAATIVALVVFIVMPNVERAVSGWLYR